MSCAYQVVKERSSRRDTTSSPGTLTDKRQEAGEHLTMSTKMYRDMGMTYWLERAEAELRKSG
jgi:hypothetical protein